VSRKLVLIVIDGLTPQVFEDAVERGTAPALSFLAEHGEYRRAVSTFPSLTPVCLSSIATGAHPSQHGIPGLVWYDREHARIVEYGSSFAAIRAVGSRQALRDAVVTMNRDHLSRETPTIFETLEAAGLTTAAVNFTVYRGPVVHKSTLGSIGPTVEGPSRFFYYSLFESDRTGAPLAVRDRSLGSIDAYAASVGRWLVTRDGFDLLVYYLPDYDFASHARGPGGAEEALARSDAAVGALLEAAGGGDAFLDRYEVILCSDHGQTAVREGVQLERAFTDLALLSSRGPRYDAELFLAASNRVAQVYRLPGARTGVEEVVGRLERDPAVDAVLFRADEEAIVRRHGEELRFRPDGDGAWETSGDEGLLSDPNGFERVWEALASPRAGDVLATAVEGHEFADIGGRLHVGGGSHGSLVAGDSEVPMLSVGAGPPPARIVDIAPSAARRLGVEAAAAVRVA
jgi:predicted AlkP superfamily pyrophosphatase or phosphodiesterase